MQKTRVHCLALTIVATVFLSTASVYAQNSSIVDYPSYQNNTLTIPRIDTKEQLSFAKDAIFKYNEKQGYWDLLDVQINRPIAIEQVNIIKTDSFPAQIFIKIKWLVTCETMGVIAQRLVNNRFEIQTDIANPSVIFDCMQPPAALYDEKIIPLPVYGLSAGTYEYSVNNGKFVGTFSLAKDNKLAITQ